MKNIKILLLLFITVSILSCTKDLEQINTNPNAPINVQPEFLLRQVLFNYQEQMHFEGFVAGNLLGQYFTAVDFNLFDRHDLSSPQFGGNPWPIFYQNLRDNQIIIDQAKDNPASAVYEGPALILKAYMAAALTDIFGDVPYSEALLGKAGEVTPKYDKQEDIYLGDNGILDNLDQGIAAINNYAGTIPLRGDILYNGDLQQWVKFANSLKIKYLMRISSQVEVKNDIQSIYSSGNYLQSNGDNATFDFTNGAPNNFRMATARIGDFNIYIMSETIDNILTNLNDSRIATYFRPTTNQPDEYQGLLNGPDASQTSISLSDYSLSGTIFREHTGDLNANFLTAWEVQFLLAEAAEKGMITADAKTFYDTGVQLAFEYWLTEMPADYLTTGNAAYKNNGADPIEQIITQKWLSNILNGFEGWIEYKRTGFPQLKPIAASLNNDLIPVRMPYPTDEEALNGEHYSKAAAATDGNSINAKVWWDVD